MIEYLLCYATSFTLGVLVGISIMALINSNSYKETNQHANSDRNH
jgi:hypothetical protein